MLKIKNEIDLKELEKFGFEYNSVNECWEFVLGLYDLYFSVSIKTREFKFFVGQFTTFDDTGDTEVDEICRVVFDLANAGFVEKL